MATGDDTPVSLNGAQPSEPHHRGRLALFVALGFLAAGGMGAAVALAVSGGNDNTVNTAGASASTTTTTTTPTTTTVVHGGGGTVPPTGAPGQAPAGSSNNKPAPATTPPPATGSATTASTQPSLPKPVFTTLEADPSVVDCQTNPDSRPSVTVTFTVTNAKSVESSTGYSRGTTKTADTLGDSFGVDGCTRNSVTFTATGPGGTTTGTVSWRLI
jgi:hypothetical protein